MMASQSAGEAVPLKPSRARKDDISTGENVTVLDLTKRLRCLLNKLTPEKYELIIDRISDLPVDTEEKLISLVNLVYTKAVDEPRYAFLYVSVISHMGSLSVPGADDPSTTITFRKCLLNKCRDELFKIENKPVVNLKVKNEAVTLRPTSKMESCRKKSSKKTSLVKLEEDLAEQEKEAHIRKSIGLVRFVGELYKKEMIPLKIAEVCVNHLLDVGTEEALLCLCEFLVTAGQQMENESEQVLRSTLKRIKLYIGAPRVSLRANRHLSSIHRLMKSKWVSHWTAHRVEMMPKKLYELGIWDNDEEVSDGDFVDTEDAEVEVEKKQLHRKIMLPLNQICPQKYDLLEEKINNLRFSSEQNLKMLVKTIFSKAINEPLYAQMYARLCTKIQGKSVKPAKGQELNFRNLMLSEFKRAFRRQMGLLGDKLKERMEGIQKAVDGDEKVTLEVKLEEETETRMIRALGLVRFIGEMYKVQMIGPKTIHNCIQSLLAFDDNLTIEETYLFCVSELLTTTGEALEQETSKEEVQAYFDGIAEVAQNATLSPRCRSVLLNVIDLRQRNWISLGTQRRAEMSPKPLQTLKREVRENSVSHLWQKRVLESNASSTPTVFEMKYCDKSIGLSDMPDAQLQRSMKGILNRLSYQKFDLLAEKFKALPLNTFYRLEMAARLIISTAVYLPMQCQLFVELCAHIQGLSVLVEIGESSGEKLIARPGGPSVVTFKDLLLKLTGGRDTNIFFMRMDLKPYLKILGMMCCSEDKKRVSDFISKKTDELKVFSIGLNRFIGELYKQGILSENSIHETIKDILTPNASENHILCAYTILLTAGQDLEDASAKMDAYFNNGIQKFIEDNGNISAETKHLLEDLVKLRERSWEHLEETDLPNEFVLMQKATEVCKLLESIELRSKASILEKAWDESPLKPPRNSNSGSGLGGHGTPDNPEIPSHNQKSFSATKPHLCIHEEPALRKTIRSLINKLTPQTFEKYTSQLLKLPLESEDDLTEIVNHVFERALDDPLYLPLYADLCHSIQKLVVMKIVNVGDGEPTQVAVTFRKLLLNKCQKEFTKITNNEPDSREKFEGIADEKSNGHETKKPFEEDHLQLKRKSIGLVGFIGELYKRFMLTPKITLSCAMTLVSQADEGSLECACKLLTSVGKQLEQDGVTAVEGKNFQDLFTCLYELTLSSCDPPISTRIKFMLQDLFELRSNGWKVKQEQSMMVENQYSNAHTPNKRYIAGSNLDSNGLKTPSNKFRMGNSSYTTTVEPSKLRQFKSDAGEAGIDLGSSGAFSQPMSSTSMQKRPGGLTDTNCSGLNDKCLKQQPSKGGSKESSTLGHPIALDDKSTTVSPPLKEVVPLSAPIEESSGQHNSTPSCLVAEPNRMGASESKAEDSESVIDDSSTLGGAGSSEETDSNEMQCRTDGQLSGDCGVIDHSYISKGLPETGAAKNRESDKCDRGSAPISANETEANGTKPGVEVMNSSIPDISEETVREARQTTEECRTLSTVESGHEVKEGFHDEATVGHPSDGLDSRSNGPSLSSSASGSSPSPKIHSEIEQVEETMARAMIRKYFTEQRSDSDNNPLPAYHVSEEKYGKLWLECPEASEMDSCEHETSSSRYSQLCPSNFIQLGPSLIGYPAISWLENGYPERSAHTDESGDCEKEETGEMRVRVWITEKSHPKSNDLKNDIFLKMCGVEEINRSDLMYPHRAYLNVDGNIEYCMNTGIQKEGIADFIDNFLRTQNFELNRKEYSPTSESIIDALSRIPQCMNSELAMSDSKKKKRNRRKRGRRSHNKSTNSEGLDDDAVKTGDFSDKSTNSPVNNAPGYVETDPPKGTDLSFDELKRGGSAVEVTRNECVDLEQAVSELSVEDSPPKRHSQGINENEGEDSLENDVSGSVPCLLSNQSGMSERNEKPFGSSKFIDKPDNVVDGKSVNNLEESCQDSPEQIYNELSMESILRDSSILQSLIDDVVKAAESKVHSGICSSDNAPSTGTMNQTEDVLMESSVQQRGDGAVGEVCSVSSATKAVVDHESMCDARSAVVIQGGEKPCVSDLVSETDDSHVDSSDKRLTVTQGVSRDDENSISEEVCSIPSATETVVDSEPMCDAKSAVVIQGGENPCVSDLVSETDYSHVDSSDEKLTVTQGVSRDGDKIENPSATETVVDSELMCDAQSAVVIQGGENPCVSDLVSETDDSHVDSSDERLTVTQGVSRDDDKMDENSVSEEVCSIPSATETVVDSEPMCNAHSAVVIQGIENICLSDSVSERDDSHVDSSDENLTVNGDVPRDDSRVDEESISEDELESDASSEETDSVSESSSETALKDDATVSESDSAETENDPTFQQSSEKLTNLAGTDSGLKADHTNIDSDRHAEDDIRCTEKVSLSQLPDSLKDVGLKVVHPRGFEVLSRLSKIPDTYWLPGSNHGGPEPNINVVKSSGGVASTLMEALEKTSSKPKEPTKGAGSAQDTSSKPKSPPKGAGPAQDTSSKPKSPPKGVAPAQDTSSKPKNPTKGAGSAQDTSSKPKCPTKGVGSTQDTSSKPKSPTKGAGSAQGTSSKSKGATKNAGSAQGTSSKSKGAIKDDGSAQGTFSHYLPPWKRLQGSQKETGSTNGKSAGSPLAKIEIIAKKLLPTETDKAPSNSAARNGGDNTNSKVADGGIAVQKSIPPFLGNLPSTSQGFVRHSLADPSTSQLDLGAYKLQPEVGATVPTSPSAHNMPGADGFFAPTGSYTPVPGPSIPVAPAPPMGAIPVRPPLARSIRPPGINYYSNRPDEFGLFVMQSMASMSPEQRTHAINVIWDVLNEGFNNALCQYTRLSGVTNRRENGKEVYRMGPSHASETQANPAVLSGQPLINYDIPSNLPLTGLFPRNLDPPKHPIGFKSADQTQASQNPVPAFQKTPASDQKLLPMGQNLAPNKDAVPPTQYKPLTNQKAQKWQKASPKKKNKTVQKAGPVQKRQAPSTSQYKFRGMSFKNAAHYQKMSSANQGSDTTKNIASKSPQKKVQNQNPAATNQNSAPKVQNASSTGANQTSAPQSKTNPATKSDNPAATSQKSAPKPSQNSSATGNASSAGEESNRQKRKRLRKAFFANQRYP